MESAFDMYQDVIDDNNASENNTGGGCMFNSTVYGHRYQICSCGRHIWSMASKKIIHNRPTGRRPLLRDAVTQEIIDVDAICGTLSSRDRTASLPVRRPYDKTTSAFTSFEINDSRINNIGRVSRSMVRRTLNMFVNAFKIVLLTMFIFMIATHLTNRVFV